jgi:hypothetical protein
VDTTFRYAVGGTGSGSGGGGGGTGSGGTIMSTVKREFKLQDGNLNLAFGAAGVRFSPWRTVLVSANLLFPLTEAGLRDRVTPVIGVDYAF